VKQDIEDLYEGREAPKFSGAFDLVFCSGLLYHLPNPAKALEWCGQLAPSLFLATHYVEPASPQSYPAMQFWLTSLRHGVKQFQGYAFQEGGRADPGSGMSSSSFWPTEAGLREMLTDAGYRDIAVLGKDLQNGYPHVTILAGK
jgi:hypothetical protein